MPVLRLLVEANKVVPLTSKHTSRRFDPNLTLQMMFLLARLVKAQV